MNNWNFHTVTELFSKPIMDLISEARSVHKAYFKTDEVELCTLLNIKTGGCPENCAYCPQSAHYQTGINKETLLSPEFIVEKAKIAKANGATRFCMGAAWRSPPKKAFPQLLTIIEEINKLGLETCLTAGMLTKEQANALKEAELDFYNHNLDTSPDFYPAIINTHSYEDRLTTLNYLQEAGIAICCGGILGLGESRVDRIKFLLELLKLKQPPQSIPINRLIPIPGTPLANQQKIDNFEFIRTIAITRILFPKAKIRLSAGRVEMSEEMQALCFLAGANSIHFGEKLLTTENNDIQNDINLLKKLDLVPIKSTKEISL